MYKFKETRIFHLLSIYKMNSLQKSIKNDLVFLMMCYNRGILRRGHVSQNVNKVYINIQLIHLLEHKYNKPMSLHNTQILNILDNLCVQFILGDLVCTQTASASIQVLKIF